MTSWNLPGFILLWFLGFLGFVFLIALAIGDDVTVLGRMLVIGLGVYAALQVWQWLSNWLQQRKFMSER